MAKQRRQQRANPELERAWRERISAWATSGLTARAYCRDHGLSEPSFYSWRRKLRQRGGAGESCRGRGAMSKPASRRISTSNDVRPPAFVPVTVVGSPAPPALSDQAPVEIVHGSGATVRVNVTADAELLTAVFTALDRACSC